MMFCEWETEIKDRFCNKVEVICSIETKKVSLTGKKCFVDQAYTIIIDLVRLVELTNVQYFVFNYFGTCVLDRYNILDMKQKQLK